MEVKIGKIEATVTVDVNALPATSVAYIVSYGLTQCLNDAHASVQRKNFSDEAGFQAEVESKVQKRLDQILTGAVPGQRAANPQAAVARELAAMMADDAELAEIVAREIATRKAARLAKAA